MQVSSTNGDLNSEDEDEVAGIVCVFPASDGLDVALVAGVGGSGDGARGVRPDSR